MGGFLTAASSFPTAIFSTLLGVVLIYWLLAVIGIVDIGSEGVHLEVHDLHLADGHAGADDIGTLAGVAHHLGLQGVPLSVSVSLVILFGWTLSCLGGMWLLPLLPATAAIGAGAILGIASLTLAVPLARIAARPLRGLFVTHAAPHNASLVGQTCKVLTGSVDEQVGRAEVAQRGTNLNIRVWAPAPNALQRGSVARIVAYDDATARYRIEPGA
jgi:hypothetical protein